MELVASKFGIPETVAAEAVLEGNRLKIGAFIDPALFLAEYESRIKVFGLTAEKAFYLAMKVGKTKPPTVPALLTKVLR